VFIYVTVICTTTGGKEQIRIALLVATGTHSV